MKEKIYGVVTAWGLKVINAITQLVLIKIIVNVYGVEGYAVFTIIAGMWGWVQFFDLGYGNALMNTLILGVRRDKYSLLIKYRKYIIRLSSATIILSYIISEILSTLIFKSIDELSHSEKFHLINTTLIIMGFTVIASMSYKGLNAINKAWVGNIYQIIAIIISFSWIIAIEVFEVDNLIKISTLIIVYWACHMIVAIVSLIYFYEKNYKKIKININESENLKKIHGRARYFFMMSIVASAAVQSDIFIASFIMSKTEIAYYSYVAKVFAVMYMVCASITQVIWPQLATILKNNDIKNYLALMRKYLIGSILLVVIGTGIIEYFKSYVINFVFQDNEYEIGKYTMILFGIYTMVRVVTEFFAASVGAYDKLKYSLLVIFLQALVSLVFGYYFAKSLGIDGLIIGATIGYLSTSFWMYPVKTYKIMQNIK